MKKNANPKIPFERIDLDDDWDGISLRSVAINQEATRLYGAGDSSLYIFVFNLEPESREVISKSQ